MATSTTDYLQRNWGFPVLPADFHQSFYNPEKKNIPKQPRAQEPRQTGLCQRNKTQSVPCTTKPPKLKSVPILIVFKHLDGLYRKSFALSAHLLFVVCLPLAVSFCLSVLGKGEAATS